MPRVTVYSSDYCPYCMWAKKMLDTRLVDFEEISVDHDQSAHAEMLTKSNGQITVPQIFIDEFHVGGYTDMVALDRNGELDIKLAG